MRFVAHPWDVCQNPKKAKIEANALKHGSKVATTFRRCLVIKHLCNKPLAFESSASANSATPALRDRSEKNTRFAGKLNIPESVECCFLSALWSGQSAEDSGHYGGSSNRKPRGGPRISRRIIALRKPDVDASNVAMSLLGFSALGIVRILPA